MKKIVWIDMDEVLAETVQSALEHNWFKIAWRTLYKEEITSYKISDMEKFKDLNQEIVDFFHNFLQHENSYNIKPVDWSYEKLVYLKNNNYKLHVITARQESLKNSTYKWIEKNFPWLIDDVHFTNHFTKNSKPKSEVCKRIWTDFMFEDNFEYAKEIVENANIKIFLLTKNWNINEKINIKKIHRLNSWNDFNLKLI